MMIADLLMNTNERGDHACHRSDLRVMNNSRFDRSLWGGVNRSDTAATTTTSTTTQSTEQTPIRPLVPITIKIHQIARTIAETTTLPVCAWDTTWLRCHPEQ